MRSLDFETRTALARFDQTLFYSHVMHVIFICNVFSFLFQFKRDGWVILKCHYDMCSFSCYFEWISILFFFLFFNREAINRVCEAAGLKTAKKRKVPYILSLSLSQKYYGGTLNYKIYLFKTWMSIIFPSKQTLSFLLCLWQGFSTEISVKDHKLKNDAPFLQCMAHSMYI